MIHDYRIETLRSMPPRRGGYVLYWMQASQRAECNHALEYAIRLASERDLPVVCGFGLTPGYPEATGRHYRFMLEGLRETQAALADRGIPLVCRLGSPDEVALDLAQPASILVTDRGYTRTQKQWRRTVAERAECPVIQVESDVIVPVGTVSDKEQYAARTIRPRIHALLPDYLTPLHPTEPRREGPALETLDLLDVDAALRRLGLQDDARQVFHGGTSQAHALLSDFISHRLDRYDDLRNDPSLDYVSHMSPYLHFGQISPLTIALEVLAADSPGEEAFLEELIVRRELSMNFVEYNPGYDRFENLPDWTQATLSAHADDPREYVYAEEQLQWAQTHDPYWNAAQREMVLTGRMHNYMRMYWGKKILEWSRSPEEAFRTALRLNNKYELDGRDPNSFAGVAWCFGKHDRAWPERKVFGKIRFMNDAGLRRKFDMPAYLEKVAALERGR